jgi:hypothetical protein
MFTTPLIFLAFIVVCVLALLIAIYCNSGNPFDFEVSESPIPETESGDA